MIQQISIEPTIINIPSITRRQAWETERKREEKKIQAARIKSIGIELNKHLRNNLLMSSINEKEWVKNRKITEKKRVTHMGCCRHQHIAIILKSVSFFSQFRHVLLLYLFHVFFSSSSIKIIDLTIYTSSTVDIFSFF